MHIGIVACVHVSNDSGCNEPIQLLEELSRQQSTTAVNVTEPETLSSSSLGHWMLRFPSQCVLTIEAVLWERCIQNAIEKENKLELKAHW